MASTVHRRLHGLTMVAVAAGIVALVVALMNQAFTSAVTVTVRADRAGLLMAPKNDVKLRGVVVGEVESVRRVDDGAELVLRMDPEQIGLVPADVRAQIVPSTAFGNKFIALTPPPGGGTGHLRESSVIRADHIGAEVNTVFANLMNVLDTVKPSQLNATLDAMATTLRGRGDQLGDFLLQVDAYLRELNPHLPALRHDLDQAAQVANLYTDVSPEFFHVLDNATKISATVVDKQAALHAFLEEIRAVGGNGSQLFAENGENLLQTLRLLEPTSSLLARYSPMLTCFLVGEDYARTLLEPSVGGALPGGRTVTNVLPGKEPYRYPDNLAQVSASSGPNCHGLPYLDGATPAPLYPIPGVGMDTIDTSQDPSLAVGRNPLGLLVGGR